MVEVPSAAAVQPDQIESLVAIVQLVRQDGASTRPELGKRLGLGRTVVTQRVEQATQLGLLQEAELGPSTGGRAPRLVRFDPSIGRLLVAVFGATHVGIGACDLNGDVTASRSDAWDITAGPTTTMAFLVEQFEELLSAAVEVPVWGVGIGVPGPVEFKSGRPIAPPIMPGWNDFDIRGTLQTRFDAPVWVDNDVNLLTLGEYRARQRVDRRAMIYVKVGTGIGAGIISEGHLHRGANGCAGDIGHVLAPDNSSQLCRCGREGCLEAVAGGWALGRDASARASESTFLSDRLVKAGKILGADVIEGAQRGDPVSMQLITASGRAVGEHVAAMTNFFNPARVAIGGSISTAGDLFMAAVREVVYRRSLPLATRDLVIAPAAQGPIEALHGAATLVTDELFATAAMRNWVPVGRPSEYGDDLYGLSAA